MPCLEKTDLKAVMMLYLSVINHKYQKKKKKILNIYIIIITIIHDLYNSSY